jgi:hypothetical protein
MELTASSHFSSPGPLLNSRDDDDRTITFESDVLLRLLLNKASRSPRVESSATSCLGPWIVTSSPPLTVLYDRIPKRSLTIVCAFLLAQYGQPVMLAILGMDSISFLGRVFPCHLSRPWSTPWRRAQMDKNRRWIARYGQHSRSLLKGRVGDIGRGTHFLPLIFPTAQAAIPFILYYHHHHQ